MVDEDTAGSTYTTHIRVSVCLVTSFPPDSDPVHNRILYCGQIISVKRNPAAISTALIIKKKKNTNAHNEPFSGGTKRVTNNDVITKTKVINEIIN